MQRARWEVAAQAAMQQWGSTGTCSGEPPEEVQLYVQVVIEPRARGVSKRTTRARAAVEKGESADKEERWRVLSVVEVKQVKSAVHTLVRWVGNHADSWLTSRRGMSRALQQEVRQKLAETKRLATERRQGHMQPEAPRRVGRRASARLREVEAAKAARRDEGGSESEDDETSSASEAEEEEALPEDYHQVKRVLSVRGRGRLWRAIVEWEPSEAYPAPSQGEVKWAELSEAARQEARELMQKARGRGRRAEPKAARDERLKREAEERRAAAARARAAAEARTLKATALRTARASQRAEEAQNRTLSGRTRSAQEAGLAATGQGSTRRTRSSHPVASS